MRLWVRTRNKLRQPLDRGISRVRGNRQFEPVEGQCVRASAQRARPLHTEQGVRTALRDLGTGFLLRVVGLFRIHGESRQEPVPSGYFANSPRTPRGHADRIAPAGQLGSEADIVAVLTLTALPRPKTVEPADPSPAGG